MLRAFSEPPGCVGRWPTQSSEAGCSSLSLFGVSPPPGSEHPGGGAAPSPPLSWSWAQGQAQGGSPTDNGCMDGQKPGWQLSISNLGRVYEKWHPLQKAGSSACIVYPGEAVLPLPPPDSLASPQDRAHLCLPVLQGVQPGPPASAPRPPGAPTSPLCIRKGARGPRPAPQPSAAE